MQSEYTHSYLPDMKECEMNKCIMSKYFMLQTTSTAAYYIHA